MRRSLKGLLLLGLCASAMAQTPAPPLAPGSAAGGPPPVETFYRRPKYSEVTLSPDGTLLAALVPINERRNLAIIDVGKGKATVLTVLKDQDVSSYRWIGDRSIEVSTANLTDESGAIELKQRLLIDLDGRVLRDMMSASLRDNALHRDTLYVSTAAYMAILDIEDRAGDQLLIETNERDRYGRDVYRYNPRTSAKELLTLQTPGSVRDFTVDHAGQVRVAVSVPRGETKTTLWYRRSNDAPWVKLRETDYEDEDIRPLAFDFDNRTLYVSARSKGEGHRYGVYAFDPDANRLGDLIFESDSIDVSNLVFDRIKQKPVGIRDNSLAGVHWLDPEWAAVQRSIDAALPGMRNRLSWGRYATDRVVVTSESESTPPAYYVFERKTGQLQELVVGYPWLDKVALSPRKFVRYPARDGLSIPAHLTLPKGIPEKMLPLIVDIHGGPYVAGGRFGYNADAQFFASRGYATLQPDFRGTLGYGDSFYKAGWRQWGLAMQDDVTDGVKWLIASGKVDPDRVCLFGASYGGYATLWGLEKEPQLFRCGVAEVAVSDLELLFDVGWSDTNRDDFYNSSLNYYTRTIGDPAKDRARLREVSPLYHAERIRAPLLLAYGAADVRVPLTHGNHMRDALDKYDKPYEWVVYDDEGHGFNKDANRYDFYRRVDAFLAKNLAPRTAKATTTASAPAP